eukprot:UN06268
MNYISNILHILLHDRFNT